MKLLVTGGAGFIGSNFVRSWLDEHPADHVVNVDLLTYAGDRRSLADVEANVGERHTFVRADIADLAEMVDLFDRERPEVVVNFAAESHNSRAVLDPLAFVRTNVLGTQVLLEAARRSGVTRFHHVSTCEVYGDMALDSQERFREDSPYQPRAPYSASKAAADLAVRAYGETFGLPYTISNSCNNYGPYQHPEKVIPLFTTSALEGTLLPLYSSREHRREWMHVEDHCRAISAILERGRAGQTYNVGSADERSIEDLADLILRLTGRASDLKRSVPDRPGHDRRYLLDHSKIDRELGWRPAISFEEGLARTVAWYRANRSWWEAKRASIPDETAWAARPG